MKPDQAIDQVRTWRRFNYAPVLPSFVVIAETDWLAYVQAMAATLPDEELAYPTEEDVLWAWPEGVMIVFAEPLNVEHTIISRGMAGTYARATPAVPEGQQAAGLCIIKKQLVPTQVQVGELGRMPMTDGTTAYPTMWISTDPSDIVQGHWLPGTPMRASADKISQSTHLLVSIITALGHRLTRLAEPTGINRKERRRAERELPGLRVLELASGASVSATTGSVNYSHRWMVRGHWRLQPYGPGRTLRKPTWIDPYVKGPEDKPLDYRPTIWRRHV